MTTDSWTPGVSADWNTSADWSNGLPNFSTSASIAGTGAYVVTLFGVGSFGSLTLAASGAELYDTGTLFDWGTMSVQSGIFDLAGGSLDGGFLQLQGGQFESSNGTLFDVNVVGPLSLGAFDSSLTIEGWLGLYGASGNGAGSLSMTGAYASLDFAGTQSFGNATVSFGAVGSQPGQAGPSTINVSQGTLASSGATLTLGAGLWLRGVGGTGIVNVGATGPQAGPSVAYGLVNQGTITASTAGEVLAIDGSGSFTNQGTIGISNGATLQLNTTGYLNTGTITLNSATLSLGGTYSTARLFSLGPVNLNLYTPSYSQIQLAGTAQNSGTLSIGLGTNIGFAYGTLLLSGAIIGGTISDGGNGLGFSSGTGVLDGVVYSGVLNLSSNGTVTLTDNTRIVSPAGAAGYVTDVGTGSVLLLRGPELLDNVQITLGSNGAGAAIATTDTWLASTATTATLGAHASVIQVGASAALDALGWSSVPGVGAADTLVNQGTISGAIAGGLLSLGGYGTFLNQGSIAISGGDTLRVTVQNFANTGTITAGAGGTVLLGQSASGFGAAPSWSNAGQIAVMGGTLDLNGAVSTGQLGIITESSANGISGSVLLAGTLSNAGATLVLGGSGALRLPEFTLAGTIAGGAIVDASGILSVGSSTAALLDGVAYRGTLSLAAGGFLRVRDGLALTGIASVLGSGAVLDFQGSQTFDGAQVHLGAGGQGASIDIAHDPTQSAGTTLTFGANLAITQAGKLATIGRNSGGTSQPGDMIVNRGTITGAVVGGTLAIGGAGFTNAGVIVVGQGETLSIGSTIFANTGAIDVNAGLLSISDSLTLAQLGLVNLVNGSIGISGTCDLGGGTLTIGQGGPDGRVQLTGTIQNGTITDTGNGLAPSGPANLQNVTYDGTLDLSHPFTQLTIGGGLTLLGQNGAGPGQILLTGAKTRLISSTNETLSAAQITLGSLSQTYMSQKLAAPELAAGPGAQLTLGSATTLTLAGTGGVLGDAGLGQWSDAITNQGLIVANTQAGTLYFGSSLFANTGTVAVSGGATVSAGDVGFSNAGMISVATGSTLQFGLYNYYAAPNGGPSPFINTGTIALHGGSLTEFTANGLFPAVALANQTGAMLSGSGTLAAPVSNFGTIDALTATLLVAQPLLGSGILQIETGAMLELAGAVSSGQTIRFNSTTGTLKLDSPAAFAGNLGAFGPGNIIDLPGQTITGASISNGTVVLSTGTLTGTQTVRLASATPFSGALSVGHDMHGGATIALTQQPTGNGSGSGTPAVVGVSQPGMLFWACAQGDKFQGVAANLNGGRISNWSSADSIDIADLAPAHASLALSQTGPTTLLSLTDTAGTLTTSVGLTGSYNLGSFHLASDGHNGTLLTFNGG